MKLAHKTPLLENGFILNGKWEILEHIATGGKGEVYRARQINLDRDVVIKTISTQYLAELGNNEEEIRTETARFRREALAMAKVRHPHVVQVYDEGSDELVTDDYQATVSYLVMEYIPGETLRSTMAEDGFRTDERAMRAWIRKNFLPVLDGMEIVHELGIVHRDIKPENVLLDGSTPKIADFGIAGGVRWQGLTSTRHVEGTIAYMAPEQFTDLAETDVRGDIYALGKMLYEAVSGRMKDGSSSRLLRTASLCSPDTRFLKKLDQIIREATAEEKENRTRSVRDLRRSLTALLDEPEHLERSPGTFSLATLGRVRRDLVIGLVAVLVGLFAGSF